MRVLPVILEQRESGCAGQSTCFFDPDRIQKVREMIFAEDEAARRTALKALLPAQRADFLELFQIMRGLPVTIRLLDPPLHEFLPHEKSDIEIFARSARLSIDRVQRRLSELHESNPMLGHRGCRLGMTYPEIYEMQVIAIFEAALQVDVIPEIMIPLIATRAELSRLKKMVDDVADLLYVKDGKTMPYIVGTMIELPRAALMAGDIAHDAAFFSFGTNDLTQTTLGMSRDDAGSFLPFYVDRGVFCQRSVLSVLTKKVSGS
jgi:pyruvate,orthophosphate dikinase